MNSDSVWLLNFYAPGCGDCKALSSELNDAATSLKGIVKVAVVDTDAYQDLADRFGIQILPAIKIFGRDKTSPYDYEGGPKALDIVTKALKVVSWEADRLIVQTRDNSGSNVENNVVYLDDSNIDDLVYNSEDHWLVNIYTPWCGNCKAMAPEFATAASELKGKFMLGNLDGDGNRALAERFGVTGFPVIKYLSPGSTGPSDAVDYLGHRYASDIVQWCLEKL